METKPQGFMAACKTFFGQLLGQTLSEFRDELSNLSESDRVEIRKGLIENGINVNPL